MKKTPLTIENERKILKRLYTNLENPSAFGSIKALLKAGKHEIPSLTRKEVVNYIESNPTYSRNKPRRLHFRRLATIPSGIMTDVMLDLADLSKLSAVNNHKKFLLVGVDVLSRRFFAAAVKNKTSAEMRHSFKIIFKQMPRLPDQIFTDNGTEFTSSIMQKFFKKMGVFHYTSNDVNTKAAVAERGIRTIKSKLYKYFGQYKTRKWIDIIDKLIDGINHSICRITGMRPVDINYKNAQQVWNRLYADSFQPAVNRSKFGVKDKVRVARERMVFRKGYLPTFSDEVYKIYKVYEGHPNTYELINSFNELLPGKYYEEELSRVRAIASAKLLFIERVLKIDTDKEEALIKFFNVKTPSWVNINTIA